MQLPAPTAASHFWLCVQGSKALNTQPMLAGKANIRVSEADSGSSDFIQQQLRELQAVQQRLIHALGNTDKPSNMLLLSGTPYSQLVSNAAWIERLMASRQQLGTAQSSVSGDVNTNLLAALQGQSPQHLQVG
jgi:hypothetical protein